MANLQISQALGLQDVASTIGSDLGSFIVQSPLDTSTDPLTLLTEAQALVAQSSVANVKLSNELNLTNIRPRAL